MNIIILGNGKWGKALGSLLLENNRDFSYWNIGDQIPNNAVIINCLPTNALREVLSKYGGDLSNCIFINGAKGIEEGTHKLPYEIIKEILGKNIDYFALIGPGFAMEIIEKMPTLVNIGYVNDKNINLVKDIFQTDYFRVRMVKGIEGLELSSAFKNVYAIACGIADGLGYGQNTKTKLILIAIEEFYALSRSLGVKIDPNMLPGTIGDLILTCSSEESRNFRFGKLLVGKNHLEALHEIGETVEGHSTISSVTYFEEKTGIKLKLAGFVSKIILEKELNIKDEFLNLVKEL